MGISPSLVSEKPAQGHGDLPALIPFGSGRHGPSSSKHVAAQLHKIRHGVAGVGSNPLNCWHDARSIESAGLQIGAAVGSALFSFAHFMEIHELRRAPQFRRAKQATLKFNLGHQGLKRASTKKAVARSEPKGAADRGGLTATLPPLERRRHAEKHPNSKGDRSNHPSPPSKQPQSHCAGVPTVRPYLG
jgi:hypothetical protein